MAGEWRTVTLGEVIELKRGYDLPARDRRPGPYPIVSSSGVSDYHFEPKVQGPGVVTGRYGTLGEVFYVKEDFWPLNTALYVCDFKGNNPRFVSYFLKTLNFLAFSDKAAVPGLNRNHLHSATVRIPDVTVQRAIACILGSLDDKIELNRRMNRTLEEMARVIFKSWFIDFDPVRAKAAVRREHPKWTDEQVSRAACPKLKPEIARLFPDSFEDSELGKIPKGWRVGCFGDVVRQLRDQENPLLSPGTLFRHFSIPAFDDGQSPKLEYGENIRSIKFQVPENSILLSKLNPEIPRVWMVDVQPGDRAVCSTEFLVLSILPPFTRSFVYCLALSPLFRQQIEGLVTGTSKSHQRAEVSSILKVAVIIPPASVVRAFKHAADSLLARTLECRRESLTLAALRDALLPKLISGELRVPDAERIAGRCA
jgi:type I restriction enzyme S subunit